MCQTGPWPRPFSAISATGVPGTGSGAFGSEVRAGAPSRAQQPTDAFRDRAVWILGDDLEHRRPVDGQPLTEPEVRPAT